MTKAVLFKSLVKKRLGGYPIVDWLKQHCFYHTGLTTYCISYLREYHGNDFPATTTLCTLAAVGRNDGLLAPY